MYRLMVSNSDFPVYIKRISLLYKSKLYILIPKASIVYVPAENQSASPQQLQSFHDHRIIDPPSLSPPDAVQIHVGHSHVAHCV